MVVLLRSKIAWEGLKTNNNNPRRPRKRGTRTKVFWKVSADTGHTQRLKHSQYCTKAMSSRLQNPP